MEGNVLLPVGCATGFLCAALLGKGAYEGVYFAFLASRANDESSTPFDRKNLAKTLRRMARHYARNGVPSFLPATRFLVRIRWVGEMLDNAVSFLKRRGWVSVPESIGSLFVAAFLFATAAVFVLLRSFEAALLVPMCALLVAAVFLSRDRSREQQLLRDQVPDALRCMEACLHAGLSLPQAFVEVAEEMDKPAKELFSRVSRDLDLGFSVEQSLVRFRENSEIEELAFVAMALDVQYVCGGNARSVLQSAEDSVVRSLDLRRSLRVQTAQARFSAQIVSVMPVFLLAIVSVVSPGFLNPFFESATGLALLVVAAGMQVMGILLVKKTLEIET